MNVPPGYFDHHKTQKLVRLAGDELAVIWPLRLWEFCQLEKKYVHENMPPEALNDICRAFMRDSETADDLLQECKFIVRDDERVTVPDFLEYNAGLFQSWEAGKKGGRPKKNFDNEDELELGLDNPSLTVREPNDNRTVNEREPELAPGFRTKTNERKGKEIKGKESNKGARAIAQAQQWAKELMLEDSRFECLNGLHVGLRLFDEFIAHRQLMPVDKRITSKPAMVYQLVDARNAVALGGERLWAQMLSNAIKNGWRGWWFPDKAVILNKELETAESQKSGNVHGVSEFPNSSNGSDG